MRKLLLILFCLWSGIAAAWQIAPNNRTLNSQYLLPPTSPITTVDFRADGTIYWMPAEMTWPWQPSYNPWFDPAGGNPPGCSPYCSSPPGLYFDVKFGIPDPNCTWNVPNIDSPHNLGNGFKISAIPVNPTVTTTCAITAFFFVTGTNTFLAQMTMTLGYYVGAPYNFSGYLYLVDKTSLNPTWSVVCSISIDLSGIVYGSYANGYTCFQIQQWYNPTSYQSPRPGDSSSYRIRVIGGDTTILKLDDQVCDQNWHKPAVNQCYIKWINYAQTHMGDYQLVLMVEIGDSAYAAHSAMMVTIKYHHP